MTRAHATALTTGTHGAVAPSLPPRRVFGALVIAALAGLMAMLGYEIVVAGRFGTRVEADALALALTLVIAIGNELVVWVSTLFIPNYVDVRAQAGAAAAGRLLRVVLTVLTAGTAALAVAVVLAAAPLVSFLAPGLPADLAVALVVLFAPIIVLLPVGTVAAGVLQIDGRFVAPGLRQLFWYGAALIALVAVPRAAGVVVVPVGMTIGLLFFGVLLLVASRRALLHVGDTTPLRPWLARMGAALLPLAVASAANYVNIAYERSIAARLAEGSLAALTYAFRLLNFPLTLVVANATTMLFPPLAEQAARRDEAAFATLVGRALRMAIVFAAPLAALALALAGPVIHVLLERGAFTANSTRLTATALAWYAPGVIGMAGTQVLARAYQALHAVRTMVVIGLVIIALNLVMMPAFTMVLGLRGLALAISISGLGLPVLMLAVLDRRLPSIEAGALLRWALRPVLASVIAALVAATVSAATGETWPGLVAGATSGCVAYAALLFVLAPEDARLVLALFVPSAAARLPSAR